MDTKFPDTHRIARPFAWFRVTSDPVNGRAQVPFLISPIKTGFATLGCYEGMGQPVHPIIHVSRWQHPCFDSRFLDHHEQILASNPHV